VRLSSLGSASSSSVLGTSRGHHRAGEARGKCRDLKIIPVCGWRHAQHRANYGERHRAGEVISSSMAESAVNQVISKRMVKEQQMRWSPRGAHLLLQLRTRVLDLLVIDPESGTNWGAVGHVGESWVPPVEVVGE